MTNLKPTITAQMIIKNEDQWVWYAIRSVLDYVQKFIIYDTGSSDQTIRILKSIVHSAIQLEIINAKNPRELAALRQMQLDQTTTDWIWLVDGDEVYPQRTINEILKILVQRPNLEGVVVNRYDLLGDVYHYQSDPRVGGYKLWNKLGHYNLRLINRHIPGLHVEGDYPNESYCDHDNRPIIQRDQQNFAFTQNGYWHATYLKRSSAGNNLLNTYHRQKYKVELGKRFDKESDLPEIFSTTTKPDYIPNALVKRSLGYSMAAAVITPAKIIKRKYLG